MSEKPKGFMGFVNPFGKGKRADVKEDTVTDVTAVPIECPPEQEPDVETTEQEPDRVERERMPDPDILREFFEKFDEEYRRLQKNVIEEVSDCRQMYRYEKLQADKYRNMVSARDVLSEILPFLTDLKNAVEDIDEIEDLRLLFAYRYKALTKKLEKKGVTLLSHDRGAKVELTQNVRVNVVATDDPELDGAAGELTQIGCIIKGEEDDPIIEKLDLYQLDESLLKTDPEVQAEAEPTTDTDEAVSNDTADKDVENTAADTDAENGDEHTATDTDADAGYVLRFNEDRTVTLIRPLFIRLEDNTVIPLVDESTELSPGKLKLISPVGAEDIGRCECTFIFGNEVLITLNISNLEFYAGLIMEDGDIMLVLYSDLAYRTHGGPIIKYKINKGLIKMPQC